MILSTVRFINKLQISSLHLFSLILTRTLKTKRQTDGQMNEGTDHSYYQYPILSFFLTTFFFLPLSFFFFPSFFLPLSITQLKSFLQKKKSFFDMFGGHFGPPLRYMNIKLSPQKHSITELSAHKWNSFNESTTFLHFRSYQSDLGAFLAIFDQNTIIQE